MFSMIPYRKREANLFGFMDDLERSLYSNVSGDARFRVDISEKDDNYLLEAELPGFDKDDINVQLDGDTLSVSANHESKSEEKDKDGRYVRRERRYGSFTRSFDVTGIDVDKIKADYKNGVLELNLPKVKAEEKAPEARKINIGSGEAPAAN